MKIEDQVRIVSEVIEPTGIERYDAIQQVAERIVTALANAHPSRACGYTACCDKADTIAEMAWNSAIKASIDLIEEEASGDKAEIVELLGSLLG